MAPFGPKINYLTRYKGEKSHEGSKTAGAMITLPQFDKLQQNRREWGFSAVQHTNER